MARFLDGISARLREGTISYGADALTVSLDDGEAVVWPWASLRWADSASRRLGSSLAPDARLELTADEVAALIGQVPALAPTAERKAHWKLVGALAAAGLSVAALVFFGVPAASGPLARATPLNVERQLGDSVVAQLDLAFDLCPDTVSPGARALQALGERLARHADYPGAIEVRVLELDIVNAFALPGGRVWVSRALIAEADNADELAAVVAHEIAHVENRDVMAALYRAMGFGLVLDAVIGGGSGAGQQLILLGGNLAEMRHSRSTEARADRRGMELLHAAGIDSRGMAGFFERLSTMEADEMPAWTEFLSSHPDTGQRAEKAREMARSGAPAMTEQDWRQVQALCPATTGR